MSPQAPPFYYLENFSRALAWLKARYSDVLLAEEHAFIDAMAHVPRESAALLVRMIMRRGQFFRTSKLRYKEIGSIPSAMNMLVELGWVESRPALSLEDLCGLLRKDELQAAFSLKRPPRLAHKRGSRQLALELIAKEQRPLEHWWRSAPDSVLKVLVFELCERLRLMFFGNFHQDWSAFVLSDLGIHRYETVWIESAARAFESREQFEHFHALYRVRELMHSDASPLEALHAMPEQLAECGWIDARRSKLLFQIGRLHEKARDLQSALTAYETCSLPEARVRTVRVLKRLGRIEQIPRVTTPPTWPCFDLELAMPDPPCSVEHLVRDHLSSVSAPVIYVENALINSLFGLLFWDAIFAPVAGAFFHPFQAAPVDLHEPDFCARRVTELDACFAQLDRGTHGATILANFERKDGLQSPFVAWGLITREMLGHALSCMPAAHLRACFERVLSDLRTHRTGLPDLIQFWPGERRYRMIEVKGPGDRVQENQARWLNFCVANGLPVEVCRVSFSFATRSTTKSDHRVVG